MSLLEVENLVLHYRTRRGPVRAVDGVSFDLEQGHTLALVGESGCGKTSTASAILRLLPKNVARYDGRVTLDGVDVMELSDEDFRKSIRWQRISMVFQGAMNSLNPTARVGKQVAEPLRIHLSMAREEAAAVTREALQRLGLPEYVERSFPHELSGGMKQRVVIAMALIMSPKVVILDEPTSALDVMTQAKIINLLKRLKRDEGLSFIFITHDFSLASELADEIGIMYAGHHVEIGPAEKIYRNPQHPYTKALLGSVPVLGSDRAPIFIPGVPPDLIEPPKACRFHPRCPVAFEPCGWAADEVATDLGRVLKEREGTGSALALEEIGLKDEHTLVVQPTDGRDLKAWEKSVRDILAVESERFRALQGVKEVKIDDGALILELHEWETPRMEGGDQKASCLLLTRGGR